MPLYNKVFDFQLKLNEMADKYNRGLRSVRKDACEYQIPSKST